MAYRRPAIEVIQEFQAAAAALALPTLPAVVVGPAYQVVDDVDAGIYDEATLGISSFAYVNLTVGAVVDLTATPASEAEANAHKAVGVKITSALLVKKATAIVGVTSTVTPTVFNDPTPGAFAGFDPDAAGAATFYVDVISGTGLAAADLGRKLVTSKTDDNNLVVAAEFSASATDVNYRILEFRESEEVPEDDFAAKGITKTATEVTISPGLTSVADDLPVAEATILLSWRALRPDLAGKLTAFTDLDSLETEFGVGSIVPSNIGPYAVNLALLNTTTEVNFTGLDAGLFTNEEQAYQSAFEFLESTEMYSLAPTTHLPAVHSQLDSHVENLSASTVGRERIGIVNRTLVETEVLVPPSGIGNVTTDAGAGNGLEGTDNKTFKDPTNGDFITDDVGVGDFLQIFSYNVLAEGVQRSVTPNERDWGTTTGIFQAANAAFTAADVGRYLLYSNAPGTGNNKAYLIAAQEVGYESVRVSSLTLPVIGFTFLVTLDVVVDVANQVRTLAGALGDTIDSATRTFDFATSGETFTSADVGRLFHLEGATTEDNDRTYTIATVPTEGGTSFTTVETPDTTEAFPAGTTSGIYESVRQVTLDRANDSVDGPTRTWTILDAAFTDDDIGRTLSVAGANGAGNNTDHTIESVISSSQVVTDISTTPVTEDFDGDPVLGTPTLTTLDLVSTAPNATEDAFILGTLHEIATIVSNSQLTLGSDPTAGFPGTLDTVEYRVLKNLSLNEQADFLAGYASSFINRRLVHTWPDVLAVSINGVATKVPGYFAGSVIAGLVAGLPSQAGFTNLTITGFVGRENSDDRFNDTQLDTIAGGGNFILTQPVPDTALLIRHQLTTDLTTIFFQELSVTKNVDLIAKFFRQLYKPFLGIYNITDTLLDLLKTRGEGGISFLKDQRVQRIGAPLRRGELTRIEESTTQPDTVEIEIDITVPLPLNNIKLTLLI